MSMPTISNYGDYPSKNPNTIKVTVGDLEVWYSYRTCVAFRAPGTELVVRQNEWGTTTGKHLNMIDGGDKKSRLSGEDFQAVINTITMTS